ncbi:hypothetical protein LZF95_00115 [Algoriphagus sp. AGSA1]|uniref:hypothetical protein n=1 Tax=Algoriphagus sp. AGSA1 TaxID=2907213 RepID=UPI001F4189CB|nr:hypothetical protein [Algoriphagus sp. AGSA1]MCE7053058.1 hypothetical protein [Algoriphagus sp. AGSA1]
MPLPRESDVPTALGLSEVPAQNRLDSAGPTYGRLFFYGILGFSLLIFFRPQATKIHECRTKRIQVNPHFHSLKAFFTSWHFLCNSLLSRCIFIDRIKSLEPRTMTRESRTKTRES